jgi:hypothetical protein
VMVVETASAADGVCWGVRRRRSVGVKWMVARGARRPSLNNAERFISGTFAARLRRLADDVDGKLCPVHENILPGPRLPEPDISCHVACRGCWFAIGMRMAPSSGVRPGVRQSCFAMDDAAGFRRDQRRTRILRRRAEMVQEVHSQERY